MCGTCGCGAGTGAGPAVGGPDATHAHGGHEARRIAVEQAILDANERHAEILRNRLAERGIEATGLVGGAGCGKTTLLEATLRALDEPGRDAVVEGDCATALDAERIRACGAQAVQIETGSLCHLDAHLVGHALEKLDLARVHRLWIENVGNLVCPAPFACGESRRVALVSTAEGDDKPLKYPALFASADLLVITKADLLPHVAFDPERCIREARGVRPGIPALLLSAKTGDGLAAWLDWVRGERR